MNILKSTYSFQQDVTWPK